MSQRCEAGFLTQEPVVNPAPATCARPNVKGKFLFVGDRKLYIKGVTYGTFRPDTHGSQFPDPETVENDFRLMAACGINAVRTYTVPLPWVLDTALRHELYVMVGLPWEQHIVFLDEPGRADEIEKRVRDGVRACAGHPAVLCFVIGNEIPSSIVRWHGARHIERFLRRLYLTVKSEVPGALVTYVNFPTTEYLDLPFLDFVCFNVYLEQRERLESYLAQLQNLAGDRPLVMAEIGLDSSRKGESQQAEVLEWQIRTIFAAGCAGLFVFSWTDEWHRGGFDIEDWDFGLTQRNRRPKPALAAVRSAFADAPFPRQIKWPRISVIVCSCNGASTLVECLRELQKLEYPNYEVIVVDDGSRDDTGLIARQYPVQLISTENRGLSSARNTGLEAASGSIVAYLDDDAYPDPHWLHYLAWTYLNSDYAAVGGPNIPPPEDGPIAECVANAPGGPVHVLTSARDAEHIPGCNCSFRKDRLLAVGGFDPRFRAAGDDVDLCWRILEKGWKIGFHAGAMVWHHRRGSLKTYWKQQKGYGKAEALLEAKWPSKYNAVGHVTWAGRLYGKGFTESIPRWRIYQGTWGSALFQRLYRQEPGVAASLPLMPEWYLLILALGLLVALSGLWPPLGYVVIPLALTAIAPLFYAANTVARASFLHAGLRYRLLTAGLHLAQPLARLWGRLNHGLTPWRHRGRRDWATPVPKVFRLWSERWQAPEAWLRRIEDALALQGVVVRRGGDFDPWDLEIRGGLLGGVRARLGLEDHGAGKQLLLFRARPVCSRVVLAIGILIAALGVAAELDKAWAAAALLGLLALLPAVWSLQLCARAQGALARAVEALEVKEL